MKYTLSADHSAQGCKRAGWELGCLAALVLLASGSTVWAAADCARWSSESFIRSAQVDGVRACARAGKAAQVTALLEMGQWPGLADRLNRATLLKGAGEGPYPQRYVQQDLRAEIGLTMSGDRLVLGHDPSWHAARVGHWIEALQDDPPEIQWAAQEIRDYELDRPRERAPEREGK